MPDTTPFAAPADAPRPIEIARVGCGWWSVRDRWAGLTDQYASEAEARAAAVRLAASGPITIIER